MEDPLFSLEDVQSAHAFFGDLGATIGGLGTESLSGALTAASIENVGKALKNIDPETHLPTHNTKFIVYILLRAAIQMTEANGPVVALIARQPAQIIRQALNILFTEDCMAMEAMKLLDRADAGAADIRRLAYIATKARPNDFWFSFHYIKNLSKINLKLSLIEALCVRFPNSLSSIGMLFATVSADPSQTPKLQSTLRAIAATYGDRLSGWGFVVFARAARNHLPAAEALKLFDHFDNRAEGAEVRGQALLEKALILHALSQDDVAYIPAAISALLTFAVLNPQHVRTHQSIDQAIGLLKRDPTHNVAQDLEYFLNQSATILINGIDIDLAHPLLGSYLDPEWMSDAQLQAFLGGVPYLDIPRAALAAEAPVVIKGVQFWDKYNDDQPINYATAVGELTLHRRAQFQYDVKEALLYSNSGLNLVLDGHGHVIRPVCQGYANFFSGFVPETVNTDYEKGRALGLVIGYGDDNYCHFLFDRAPLLEHVLRSGDLPDFIVIEEKLVNWCCQVLALIGVDIEVRPIRGKTYYRFQDLRLFTSTMHPGHFWTDEHMAFFERFRPEPKAQTRRIFIKRPQGRRGLVNEAEIHAIAQDKGFEIMELEKLTMAQQCAAFAEAEFIAGVHGAGFSNMVFSQSGTKVLELARKGYITGSYSITAGRFEMPYAILLDEGPVRGGSDGRRKFEDLDIDPKKFAAMIDDMAAL